MDYHLIQKPDQGHGHQFQALASRTVENLEAVRTIEEGKLGKPGCCVCPWQCVS